MLLDSGVGSSYVGNWTPVEGLREVLQNYLDAREEFKCEGRVDYRGGKVTIHDRGPGLHTRHFALGVSEKSEDMKGKYGEGLTIGLIALARLDRGAVVRAHGKEYRPILKQSENWGTETLHLDIQEAATPEGTQVIIDCTREELDEAKKYFIEFARNAREFKWLERNRISLPGGNIYINGTKEGAIKNAAFSYHIGTEDLPGDRRLIGNRDRNALDMDVITPIIRKMLARTSSTDAIEAMLTGAKKEKTHCFEVKQGPDVPFILSSKKPFWKGLFNKVFGDNTVLSTSPDNDAAAQYEGYNVVKLDYPWSWVGEHIDIPKAGNHRGEAKGPKRMSWQKLTDIETDNFDRALMLTKHFYADPYKRGWKIEIAETLHGVMGTSSSQVTAGLCDYDKKIIWLCRDILKNFRQTLHTLLHEVCHMVSGYGDCSSQFERALLDIAVGIIDR